MVSVPILIYPAVLDFVKLDVFFLKLKLQPTTVLLGGLNVLNPLSKDVSSLQKLPLCNLYQIEI
jgi:hypothetical protein